ncbi:unnamed protein product [Blepharisma stoltei]|uniref:RING-type domain-containing protein n=1 Tax=Blepharisma stoltei TaxID=1481888 RepID=A0AAU9JBZ3_9CILI|nr:unnamed protein product [Blepharisma stoltei]
MVQCIRFLLCQCIIGAIGYSIYYHDKYLCDLIFVCWTYSLLALCLQAHVIISCTKNKASCASVYLAAFHIPVIYLDFIGGAIYFVISGLPSCYHDQGQLAIIGAFILFVAFNCLNLLASSCIMLSHRRRQLRRRENENLSYLLDANQQDIGINRGNIQEPNNIHWMKELKVTRAMLNMPCTICLENFIQSEKFVELPCLHAFHPKCIMRWHMVDHSCPMCRQRLD